jgi:hypothetical protein
MDITYIPMARALLYLVVALGWFSRRVLSRRLSITIEAAFRVKTLNGALAHHGKLDVSTPTMSRSSHARPLRRAHQQWHRDRRERQRMHGATFLRRAAMAHRQIRGSTCMPTKV